MIRGTALQRPAAVIAAALLLAACGGGTAPAGAPGSAGTSVVGPTTNTEDPAMGFTLSTTAFEPGGAIPSRFTCDGEDVSPSLAWAGAPDATRSLLLIVDDPDARGFVHWMVYGLAGAPSGALPEGEGNGPGASSQGRNDFGRLGYGGPCPPSGSHRYRFTLYALDATVGLAVGSGKDRVQAAMQGHVLAQAQLIGTYRRQ